MLLQQYLGLTNFYLFCYLRPNSFKGDILHGNLLFSYLQQFAEAAIHHSA